MLYSFLEVVCLMFHLVFMIVYLKYMLCKLSVGSKVLCMLIKLVCLGISLITTQDGLYHTWKAVRCLFMWHKSFFALFNHWMYYIHKFRKKDACSLNTSTLLQCSVSASWHHIRIQISQILFLTMCPKNLLGHGAGSCVPPPAVGGMTGLWPGSLCPSTEHHGKGGCSLQLLQLSWISIYILKDIHIYFFSLGSCYVAIISFCRCKNCLFC